MDYDKLSEQLAAARWKHQQWAQSQEVSGAERKKPALDEIVDTLSEITNVLDDTQILLAKISGDVFGDEVAGVMPSDRIYPAGKLPRALEMAYAALGAARDIRNSIDKLQAAL